MNNQELVEELRAKLRYYQLLTNELSSRLKELEEIHKDDDGKLIWTKSGDYVIEEHENSFC